MFVDTCFTPKILCKALNFQHSKYLRVGRVWGAMDRLGGVPTFGLAHPGLGEEGLGLAKPGLGEEGLGLAKPGLGEEGIGLATPGLGEEGGLETPGLGEEGGGGTTDSLAKLLC